VGSDEGQENFFLGCPKFRHREIEVEEIEKMNRVERISREAEQMAFEYRELFNDRKELSEADVHAVQARELTVWAGTVCAGARDHSES
jgi:hypothetical protein